MLIFYRTVVKENIEIALTLIIKTCEQQISSPLAVVTTEQESCLRFLEEHGFTDPTKAIDHFSHIQERFAIANFGVNEGAVGEKKVLGTELKVGWHESIRYTNEAFEQLNSNLRSDLAELSSACEPEQPLSPEQLHLFDNLSAMYEVGSELDDIWHTMSFADSSGNQFKAAGDLNVFLSLQSRSIWYKRPLHERQRQNFG
jgi:hypothetical protein